MKETYKTLNDEIGSIVPQLQKVSPKEYNIFDHYIDEINFFEKAPISIKHQMFVSSAKSAGYIIPDELKVHANEKDYCKLRNYCQNSAPKYNWIKKILSCSPFFTITFVFIFYLFIVITLLFLHRG